MVTRGTRRDDDVTITHDLADPEEAVSAIRCGDTVMVGGFGLVGAPLTLIDALVDPPTRRT